MPSRRLARWQRTLQSSHSGDPGTGPALPVEARGFSQGEAGLDSHPKAHAAGATGTADFDKPEVGVGPHSQPWPTGNNYDPVLLAEGDRRNVVDEYRYWSREAIIADLDTHRHKFHVAIENWEHDFNIGTVVRNANAFLAGAVHIVGKKRWNRRGAMVTDRYQHVHHHGDFGAFAAWAASAQLPIIGIDNIEGSVPIESATLPEACILLFGQEGPGLTEHAQSVVEMTCAITQYGSTRSMNAGVASGIAMYAWASQHLGD
ncbi:rRNA methyltransferase [bacterium]|nr:rRNA methyltransferase [bacterium]